MASDNLVASFFEMAERRGDRPFLWAKANGSYQPWSWSRVAGEVRAIANCLADAGLAPGERVLLVSENRPEWCISDLAIMTAGGVTIPAYTTNTTEDHAYLIRHSGAAGIICSSDSLAKRLIPAMKGREKLRFFLRMNETGTIKTDFPTIESWQAALTRGDSAKATNLSAEINADDAACFIYTSGTSGNPKGVILSHRNILANARSATELLRMVHVDENDVFLSFLPLSHAYEHTAGQFLPMTVGAQIYYAESIESLTNNLAEAKPTILPCVPRLFEVLRQKILAGVKRQGGLKEKLFNMTVDLGTQRYRHGGLNLHLRVADMALDRLVRAKVKERFGGRLKAMVSGGAPLNEDIGLFFHALGLPILQGYGQTEASPVISANLPSRSKIDTVGPPLPGVEVCIADDGEILVRGDNVMPGYWNDPEATAAALQDGWLHTGDIGEFDNDGYLKITDRKKDIIVNSGGDNIAPQRVEGILQLEPEIGQAIVFGDKKPYLVALLVMDSEKNAALQKEHSDDQMQDAVRSILNEAVKRANSSLGTVERIRRFAVVEEAFSTENQMMTPTMKLRRAIIRKRFADVIDGLYNSKA